jgi:hypothetical protein
LDSFKVSTVLHGACDPIKLVKVIAFEGLSTSRSVSSAILHHDSHNLAADTPQSIDAVTRPNSAAIIGTRHHSNGTMLYQKMAHS